TGLVMAPRGMGTMLSFMLAGNLMKRIEPRIMILAGLALCAWSMYLMSQFALGMNSWPLMTSGFVQGVGTGLIFVPLSTMAFATLDARLRNEGAAMFTLIRNIGSAIGISVLQAMTIRNTATVHSRLVEGVRPDNPVMQWARPDFDFGIPAAVAQLNAAITRQATMVSYIDAFHGMFLLSLVMVPMILLMRPARKIQTAEDLAMHLD
ncbi:MAG: MFS transporter, partial [Sphingomonadales bacterium]